MKQSKLKFIKESIISKEITEEGIFLITKDKYNKQRQVFISRETGKTYRPLNVNSFNIYLDEIESEVYTDSNDNYWVAYGRKATDSNTRYTRTYLPGTDSSKYSVMTHLLIAIALEMLTEENATELQVNHKTIRRDGKRSNSFEDLEVCTQDENLRHSAICHKYLRDHPEVDSVTMSAIGL